METKFQVLVSIERVDVEGPTFEQLGEMAVLGTFTTLEDAQSFVAGLPLQQAPQPAGPVNFDN